MILLFGKPLAGYGMISLLELALRHAMGGAHDVLCVRVVLRTIFLIFMFYPCTRCMGC